MSDADLDLQPETDEVLQAEAPELTAVPTRVTEVCAPVRVQALPRKAGSTRTRTVGTSAVRVLTADHYRARAVLVAPAPFLLAYSEAAAQDPSAMCRWPADMPFVCGAAVEVWVAAETDTVAVSVATERWAAGE